MRRLLPMQRSASIAPDGIPGGIEITNGICWPDGTPRRYDSRSEMRRVAKDLGLQNIVRHVAPDPGSDKAPHTVRWVSAPVISEEERIRAWHEHERVNHFPPPKPVTASGVGLVVEENAHLSEIIADCVLKLESSGYNPEADRGVNPPAGGYGQICVRLNRD